MSIFKALAAAVLFAATASVTSLQPAQAQGTTVMVIDDMQILRDSKAGKDIQKKLQNIETQINNELEPTRKSLEDEAKALQPKLEGKTREAIAADTALVSQLGAFQKKSNDFNQKRAIAAREFSMTEEKAIVDFNKALEPVLMEVIREKGAQVVLLKSQAVFSADTVDASSAIITKLDAKTPAIAVTRQKLPAAAPQGGN
ncbi:OmpH family outer membrane protein [Hyphomonas sp. WL0036]|uniref:OmpH family outer membrane protein n=1 Tax=Hyphomonas sediminis TaxID=2866160 RepID=UPI001C7E7BE4|nr:OmpH family outer membrane protein [Hyphomonas sediminis]MBY9067582.1 OmpH family outer membrane protein [Hyphomonas sediminis]